MKKVLQSVAVALTLMFSTYAHAQLPNNGIYPGGLMLDSYQPSAGYSGNVIYNMGTWDIDSILDSGTPVILDLFASWCGPCWNYHTGGTLEGLYDNKGWGGTGEVAIFGVESDPSTAATKLEGGDQGDWINNTKYPMVNHNTIANMFNLAYYPTLVMICPDRTVSEVGQVSESNWITAMNNCSAPATATNDPRVLSVDPITVAICQQTTADISINVTVQNYSTSSISGAYDFVVLDASNNVVASSTANLNLAPYAVQNVNIGTITANIGSSNYTSKITTPNDNLSNDSQNIEVTVNDATVLEITPDKNVRIELSMDAYASEVGFALREGIPTGDASSEWSSANSGNSIAYLSQGSLSNGTSSFGQDYTINNYGCHFFVTYDDYGDGITYQYPNGEARLISNTTDVITGNWNSGILKAYEFVCTQAVYNDVVTYCGNYTWIDGNTYTSSNNTATYTVANAVGSGCDSIYSLDLTIVNTVDVSTTLSISGKTITANATGSNYSYQWIDCDNNNTPISGETNASFTPTVSGNYAVVVTLGSCSNTSACVFVNAIDNSTTLSNSGTTITANATGSNYSYQWIDCDNNNTPISGETNASYTATANGNYAVIITLGNYSDTSACEAVTTVGIDDVDFINNFNVYPNPARSMVNIKFDTKNQANVNVSLINTLGQNVYTNALGNVNGSQNVQINTADFVEGIYLVNVTVNGNTTTQRISIVK